MSFGSILSSLLGTIAALSTHCQEQPTLGEWAICCNVVRLNSMPDRSSALQNWIRTFFRSSSAVAGVAALATMLGTVTATFFSMRDKTAAESRMAEAEQQSMFAKRQEIEAMLARYQAERLAEENATLRKTFDAIRRNGKEPHFAELSPADRQQLQQVTKDEGYLQTRLSALETTLMATPEKAIAVPMLKQQIDTVQDRSHADIEGIRGELARLFTLTQWFIGLMFTIALGVFGLALSNLKKSTGKPASVDRPPADKAASA